MDERPLFHNPSQAAEIACVGRSTIYAGLADGSLSSFKIGRRRLIAHQDLIAWVESHRVPVDVEQAS